MSTTQTIRIPEKNDNRKGDLFGLLIKDLFYALGYEDFRLNVHKTGREIDIIGKHRLEPRGMRAECKATSTPIGGNDINKFAGALGVEASEEKTQPLTGYFVSLSGFTETAREQEKQRKPSIILLDGATLVEQLIQGRAIISATAATEYAGQLRSKVKDLALDPIQELIAHHKGLIWTIFYTQGKLRTHYALIHGDGTPLLTPIAIEVIQADKECNGTLHEMTCLNLQDKDTHFQQDAFDNAIQAYQQYIAEECGYIQLDGLPADGDIGSRKILLESLFVPLTLLLDKESLEDRKSVGDIISQHPRLALLAAPGGGKSTLIKRLAVAYLFPNRRTELLDNLPNKNWFPLFFRCRELRGLARRSFNELLNSLSEKEGIRQHCKAFRQLIDEKLIKGEILLLVDGLDEISDPGDRAAFVSTLRTALQAYPDISFIATSREAGFRHIATQLSTVCIQSTIADFSADDISRLSLAWHKMVIGDTEKVRIDATELARNIAENDRILRLAANPLLLTTLLLVRRWVGSLPTRRSVLYDKAVEVLLMTWNTEGHDPMPIEEALPQLCYTAAAMMIEGKQKISGPQLTSLINQARNDLPTELGYVQESVDSFIHRVEDRSSLLMMSGHDIENGRLVEFFEFRHLTFQEFLAARAVVEGWHHGRQDEDTITDVLTPHFDDPKWLEVVPLAAALRGKDADKLILSLVDHIHQIEEKTFAENPVDLDDESQESKTALWMLVKCIADEVQAKPSTIQSGINTICQKCSPYMAQDVAEAISLGKYGRELRDQSRLLFNELNDEYVSLGGCSLFAETILIQTGMHNTPEETQDLATSFAKLIKSHSILEKCEGSLGIMNLAFQSRNKSNSFRQKLDETKNVVSSVIGDLEIMSLSNDIHLQFASVWAFVWISDCDWMTPTRSTDFLGNLFRLSTKSENATIRRFADWAFRSIPLMNRDEYQWCSSLDPNELPAYTVMQENGIKTIDSNLSKIILAYYRKDMWTTDQIRAAIIELPKIYNGDTCAKNARKICEIYDIPITVSKEGNIIRIGQNDDSDITES